MSSVTLRILFPNSLGELEQSRILETLSGLRHIEQTNNLAFSSAQGEMEITAVFTNSAFEACDEVRQALTLGNLARTVDFADGHDPLDRDGHMFGGTYDVIVT